MEVKSYRAKTLQDALRMVHQDLGPSAAVIQTRQVWDGIVRGLFGKRQFEVTASDQFDVPSRFVERVSHPAWQSESELQEPLLRNHSSARQESPLEPTFPPPSLTRSPASSTRSPMPRADEEDFGRRFRDQLHQSKGDWGAWLDSPPHVSRPSGELPQSLFHLYTDLVDADVDQSLARELISELRDQSISVNDPSELKAIAIDLLANQIRVQPPIEPEAASGHVVALVGPTGVGKTTTIAKLAANFRLREKRNVGLITVDTYRIAAVEQLRTYADIIDLPMEVVSTAREMRDAMHRMSHLDLILMDTAGRSPRDEIKIRELKAILSEAQVNEIHLVLSATASQQTLMKTARQFSAVGTTALVITKLDESSGLGNLLPLWRDCKLPVSYVTNGQNVPDDIRSANARWLASSLLGQPDN